MNIQRGQETEADIVRPRSLPLTDWPKPDRAAWEAACASGGRLRRGGAAAHMAQTTQADLERRYGYFLDHVARKGRLEDDAGATAYVTLENIETFVAEMKARVRSVTTAQTVYKVRRVAELLAPERDLLWLRDIENDLAFDAIPQNRAGQLVDGQRLLEAGLALVKEGEIGVRIPPFKRVRLVRNGLMVAMLALCPIRLKNFAALEIGSSIRNEAGVWWITLDRRETKGRRPDERPLHEVLHAPLTLYLRCARPVLARKHLEWRSTTSGSDASDDHGSLWLDSNLGRPMSYSGVEEAVAEATLKTLGVALRPHAFRMCAASTAYVIAGDNPHLASGLLQHTDSRVTQKHYNRATHAQAALAYAELVKTEAMRR